MTNRITKKEILSMDRASSGIKGFIDNLKTQLSILEDGNFNILTNRNYFIFI